jgi:hypothetical protein
MLDKNKLPTLALGHPESAQPVFKNGAELEQFWNDFQSKVNVKLEYLNIARAKSEEDARHLWLRRQPVKE